MFLQTLPKKKVIMAKRVVDKLFEQYQHLAPMYAAKVFSYENIWLEKEDIVQELSMKIYQSILSYSEKWMRYKKGEEKKPVPLKAYLMTALSNKVLDITKLIDRQGVTTPMSEVEFDYGIEDDTRIDVERNEFMLNGVDILEGLSGNDRTMFVLYIRGHKAGTLRKICPKYREVIDNQRTFLIKKYGSSLTMQTTVYKVTAHED